MDSTTHIQLIPDIIKQYGDETSGCAASGTSRKDMLPKGSGQLPRAATSGIRMPAPNSYFKWRLDCIHSIMECRSGSLGMREEVVYSCKYETWNCFSNRCNYDVGCYWFSKLDYARYGRTFRGAGFFCLCICGHNVPNLSGTFINS